MAVEVKFESVVYRIAVFTADGVLFSRSGRFDTYDDAVARYMEIPQYFKTKFAARVAIIKETEVITEEVLAGNLLDSTS